MNIKTLKLKNYRNYENLNINFSPGVNIFVGNNAQGKSNVLESIFVLALTKSYMNVKDQNLIKDGKDCAFIEGTVFRKGKKFQLDILLSDNEKKIKCDENIVKRYTDYISLLKVIIFSPYNFNFVKEGPNVRRRSINAVISQISDRYVHLLQKYNILLKKRNQFLKNSSFDGDYFNCYLNVLDQSFCSIAVDIYKIRNKFIRKINSNLSDIFSSLTGDGFLELKYVSNVFSGEKGPELVTVLKKNMESNLEREKRYGVTLLGIHRDDFEFFLNGKSLSIYGSQGQIRSAILALKLSEVLVFKELDNEYPILLLDDVFSELDIDKRNKLVTYLLEGVQTIITTTDIEQIDEKLISSSKIFEVCAGKIADVGKRGCKNE